MKKSTKGLVATLLLATLAATPAHADGVEKPTNVSVNFYIWMYCDGTDSLRGYLDMMRTAYPRDWNGLRPDLLLQANNIIRFGFSACPAR